MVDSIRGFYCNIVRRHHVGQSYPFHEAVTLLCGCIGHHRALDGAAFEYRDAIHLCAIGLEDKFVKVAFGHIERGGHRVELLRFTVAQRELSLREADFILPGGERYISVQAKREQRARCAFNGLVGHGKGDNTECAVGPCGSINHVIGQTVRGCNGGIGIMNAGRQGKIELESRSVPIGNVVYFNSEGPIRARLRFDHRKGELGGSVGRQGYMEAKGPKGKQDI